MASSIVLPSAELSKLKKYNTVLVYGLIGLVLFNIAFVLFF